MQWWKQGALVGLVLLTVSPAQAAVEFCNRLPVPLDAAFAYKVTNDTPMAKGWYNIKPGECEIVHAADDQGPANGQALYHYYATAFLGEDQLSWVGRPDDPNAQGFCLPDEPFDNVSASADCARLNLPQRMFMPLLVPVEPGRKHVVEFRPPASMAATPAQVQAQPPAQIPASSSAPAMSSPQPAAQ